MLAPTSGGATGGESAGGRLRLGLEGRILSAMMLLLVSAMAAACWVWATRADAHLSDNMGEQARQIAYTLSLAVQPAMAERDTRQLRAVGEDLVKARNVLFVVYYDAAGGPLEVVNRGADGAAASAAMHGANVQSLMRVRWGHAPDVGDFLDVCAPVFDGAGNETRLTGYVALGMSPAQERAEIGRVNAIAAGVGLAMVLLCLPMSYFIVHRICQPIRQLVSATHRISRGDLEAQVAADRTDDIGELARAFNVMVRTVKRQQQDLQEANHQLEGKVAQRTAQLEAANKRLSSEIAEKEDFLRAISHDLNAPLRNISGMATMLLMKHREKFDEDVIHRLERIQKNVEVETGLIGELLELSRIKTRRQKMELVEVGPLVKDLEGIFENDLRERGIALKLDTPLPVLNVERARLQQVFQNLIDNAIKYMGDGPTREIHVGCLIRSCEAEFYVRDTGMGIDPEDIEKVFFVFRRGKNSAAQNIAGKGVGLSSVKSIIETYSGTIWVQSQPGQGSTFRFTINGQYVHSAAGTAAARAVEEIP